MADMPVGYYDRYDPNKKYERHLFRAGNVLQSAELNELQSASLDRLKGLGDALFKDGDVLRDARIVVVPETGATTCESGAVYIRGVVRGVAPATFTIPIDRTVAVGIWLIEEVVTESEDPELRDPATGTRAYNEPGAARLRVTPQWGWDDDGTENSEFFPVYYVDNGHLRAKEPPPAFDSITQAIARYDRDSSGSNYVVDGLRVTQLADNGGAQVYNVQEGRARVNGFPVTLTASRRVVHDTEPDTKFIDSEPHTSASASTQRINVNRTPINSITQVRITEEKTVSINHGTFAGAQDPLPDTAVIELIEVKQGETVFVAGVDYQLTSGRVDWSLGGDEPAPGSTYTVTYHHIKTVSPEDPDSTGFSVTGAVAGTLILVNYWVSLPRIDRLCLNEAGEFVWVQGVSTDYNPVRPMVPSNLLALAQVEQTWDENRRVIADGVRVVPMSDIEAMNARMDLLTDLIAQQKLVSDVNIREAAAKKGLFVDPFLNDDMRDQGIAQTAAIVDGILTLPIDGDALRPSNDIEEPASCAYTLTPVLSQELRTGTMKINPYMAFDILPSQVALNPPVDRWTEVETVWTSPITRTFVRGQGGTWGTITQTTTTRQTALVQTTRQEISTLRQIEVRFTIKGFGPGEELTLVTFDGIPVTPEAV